MAVKADLHLHSSASDGLLSSTDLVAFAAHCGLTDCALTDHDTLNGAYDAMSAAQVAGIRLWPGVEMSTEERVEVHILGYFAKPEMGLIERLEALRQMRIERLHEMVYTLESMGICFEPGDIVCSPGSAPGRMHVARALVARGYAPTVNEAFKRYLVKGRRGFVPRKKLAPEQAIAIIRQFGGVPVVAHPGIIPVSAGALFAQLNRYVEAGMMGIEVYHPRHMPAQRAQFRQFAQEQRLLITGGSDYHGVPGAQMPGEEALGWTTMEQDYTEFLAKIEAQS